MNTIKAKISDVLTIAKALWFMIVLQLLAALAFIIVPQGQDMINAIMDDLFKSNVSFLSSRFLALILSQVGLLFWSMQTSFGARILLLFSDFSFYAPTGTPGVQDKINRRKRIAELFPLILSVVPAIIMVIAYTKAYFYYDSAMLSAYLVCLIVSILMGVGSYIFIRTIVFSKIQQSLVSNQLQLKAYESLTPITKLTEVGVVKKVFYFMLGFAVFVLVLYCALGIRYYQFVGALHLITTGFGVWVAIAWWVDYMDKRYSSFLKTGLFIVMCMVSYFNHDHPVRILEGSYVAPTQNVVERFDQWYANQRFNQNDTVPVFFVSAEGGASRSGFWTSQVLAHLHDTLPDFDKHIFSFSSVSGGTLGVNFYNCLTELDKEHDSLDKYEQLTKDFYSADLLAPTTGTMVFGELFNLFSFNMIKGFDRAGVLERTWEKSWNENVNESNNLMSKPFNEVTSKGKVVLINSTEVETGKRAILSNIKVDSNFNDVVNLQYLLNTNVRYSTAILFSARFPYLSPAASVQFDLTNTSSRRHFVDGGYFENMGNITTMEVINAIKQFSKYRNLIKPVILLITNDDTTNNVEPLRFGNELLEAPSTMLSV
ncbi:MAG: patatin-like phospholipase family protein [Bacteroidia bacterium]|jgi:hypothetical protein|nr:patatin-like phospholipase family protein [Bacteroidia bacterium]